jgi:hypothetical protein
MGGWRFLGGGNYLFFKTAQYLSYLKIIKYIFSFFTDNYFLNIMLFYSNNLTAPLILNNCSFYKNHRKLYFCKTPFLLKFLLK